MIRDFDGNTYTEVKIGKQIWLKENLKAKHYRDGRTILEVYAYNDDEKNVAKYGRLYPWSSISSGNPCPEGYHIATDNDYLILEKDAGMADPQISSFGWRSGADAASKLKEKESFLFWQSACRKVQNSSGFSSLPGGVRTQKGKYIGLGTYADYWTSTEDSDDKNRAYNRSLVWLMVHPGKRKVYRSRIDKSWGFSVRMVKDL